MTYCCFNAAALRTRGVFTSILYMYTTCFEITLRSTALTSDLCSPFPVAFPFCGPTIRNTLTGQQGNVYFVDHVSQSTSWTDPRDQQGQQPEQRRQNAARGEANQHSSAESSPVPAATTTAATTKATSSGFFPPPVNQVQCSHNDGVVFAVTGSCLLHSVIVSKPKEVINLSYKYYSSTIPVLLRVPASTFY